MFDLLKAGVPASTRETWGRTDYGALTARLIRGKLPPHTRDARRVDINYSQGRYFTGAASGM
jgi:hypothetical protein